ncbi:putative metal-dependent hydrolase [Lutibacter sp. HS1-25]|uniref:YfiT family bacillithiol transferase n=1 Tax=Lutibacter sp. HS1-25 TaxID=2485000 RepID=UPI00101175E3|nr:putative metal-dependent hydrolase [Lutibacter sp. HS1-25]RXP45567.1 putative metal-dependent hydrolase [Lutibacter sp. HS1-25]
MLEKLKYPIGKPLIPLKISEIQINEWISIIEEFPSKLEKLVIHLSNEQLDTVYRENGWTIRQVIHHCADSHLNSYIRFKLALTEDTPIIKAYYEERWAELFDSSAPIAASINLINALHVKWTYLLKGLNNSDLKKSFIHPETKKTISLAENICIYAWHCNHHYAHIYNLMERENWLN